MTDAHDPTLEHAQPFLKWAGGKSQLLDQYDPFFPAPGGDFYEPFVGSGAVFFHLRKRGGYAHYHLSDVNPDLVNCYHAVRNHIDALVEVLAEHAQQHTAHGDDYYYRVRAWDRDPSWQDADLVTRAARMIYLNKTCYNGLWRVNSKGQFNVPVGRYTNPTILDEERLRVDSRVLEAATITTRGFRAVLEQAQPGDFVYFDPPYHPLNATSSFTSYAKDGFGPDDQRALAAVFAGLDARGCRVMLSNSDTPFIRDLYQDLKIPDLRIETVRARRAINSQSGKRGKITEVAILNYDPHTRQDQP